MKVLFYSHFFPPETGAASVRANYFVNALRENGFEVLVIAPKPNYPLGKVFDGFEKTIINKDDKKGIINLPILAVSSHSPFGRLVSYLSYSIVSFFYLIFKNYRPDLVIASSPPIFTSFAAMLYSKIKKSKFIFDIRDVWPDIGIELGILKNHWFIFGLKWIEKTLLNNSDQVIVTAQGDQQNINRKIRDTEKCRIVFNGADTDIFRPISNDKKLILRKKYNIPADKKVIVYFGSYNNGMNDIEILGKFLTHDKIKSKNIHFLSIGSGDNLTWLLKTIDNKITYTYFGSVATELVAELVASSEVSIIPRKSLPNDTGGNIPVKCFESWAAGIPVLLSNIPNSEISNIFNKIEGGVLVQPNNVESLVFGYEYIISKNLKKLSLTMRNFVVDNYDRKLQTKRLIDYLNILL